MAVLKYKNADGQWEAIPHVIQGGVSEDTISYTKEQNLTDEQKETARTNIGAISQAELDDAVANIGGGGSGDFVSYSETQDLTAEQKEIARNNIGAVDASLVVDELNHSDHIPNGAALTKFTTKDCVMSAIEQNLSDNYKRTARNNIGAVSQDEFDTTIGNINSILATVVSGGAS